MDDKTKEKRAAVEKTHVQPFAMEYQEDVLKTRRNLLVTSAVAVVVWAAGLEIGSASGDVVVSPFFGVTLKGMTHRVFLWSLLGANSYLLLHFAWASIDAIREYRLRRSGASAIFRSGSIWGNEGVDAPLHPRQATLYSWWWELAKQFDGLPGWTSSAQADTQRMITALEKLNEKHDDPSNGNLVDAIRAASDAKEAMIRLEQVFGASKGVLSSERIPSSLQHFDEAFSARALSQNSRWLILEFGFPFVLGFSACFMILAQLFPRWWVFACV